jgi:type II secretory pathway pseudopilin PulG
MWQFTGDYLKSGITEDKKQYASMQKTGVPEMSTTSRSAGYTLAELAICLCIIGILMSGSLLGTSHFFKSEKTAQTRKNLDFVRNVLSTYAQTHYRLPCPADQKADAACYAPWR